ncbi:ATP-dependent helicase [Candidatus Woesearchaeota archaeon]|nr:ATP-dependent helicase [Candidatus Woesearchaeota archaeon]
MIRLLTEPHDDNLTKGMMQSLFRKWFFNKFKELSEPQRYAMYNVHCRINTLVSAPTGSGKTLCAFGAILNELIGLSERNALENKVYCVYVNPLKALSRDIEVNLTTPLKEMEELAGKPLGIRVATRTGDTSASEKSAMLKKPPHILITTPESLAIMLSSSKFIENLKQVEWCIVDEVHALAENKRGVHLSLSLERLHFHSQGMCRIGLSATVSPLDEVARFLVGVDRPCDLIDVKFIKKMDLQVLCPVSNIIDTPHETLHRKMYEMIDSLIQEHKTTLIFTNTRAATERVVNHLKEKFPAKYLENIGAHHGSLSKETRYHIEDSLRQGKLKVVVTSTSLELGIDIGFIDLVILLGSPKSIARCLQRIGRSGHKLHEVAKGRIIVLDRDDLVECSVLLKNALEQKIDRINIPKSSLDVLAQQIFGMAIEQVWDEDLLLGVLRRSYCYQGLSKQTFNEILDYLSGAYASLEDRHVYAKIWRNEGKIGKKGMMSRVMYMTNVGTIPDESFITVKVGDHAVGHIDEAFLERLKRGDVFVLGGEKYEFQFARGMVAQVTASVMRPPTIPSWASEMLPLSYDLALDIGKFRRLLREKFTAGETEEEILAFINRYVYADQNSAHALYDYMKEQFAYAVIPNDKNMLIEHFEEEKGREYYFFHALYGRRVNDVLARAVAFAIARMQHRDVEIGINDHGFSIASESRVDAKKALQMLKANELRGTMELALDKTEILKRRFRHCAGRALMILRNYRGHRKRVGMQQVSSQLLLAAVRRISEQFPILKEARREVLNDLMDLPHAQEVLTNIESGDITLTEITTQIPSPFAFNLYVQGFTDVIKIEEKVEFLRRMHEMVLAKIELKKGKKEL